MFGAMRRGLSGNPVRLGAVVAGGVALCALVTLLHPVDLGASAAQAKKPVPASSESDTKAGADAKPPAPPAKAEAVTAQPAPVAASAPTAAAEPVTVQHAATAKLTHCTALIKQAVQFTLSLPHSAALSTWSKDNADAHMFQSMMGLDYDSKVAPKAAAVLVATPEASGCEATLVQIQPTARACGDIEADLRRTGSTITELSGVPVTPDDKPVKHMLLPVPGSGCVVVGVGLALNP